MISAAFRGETGAISFGSRDKSFSKLFLMFYRIAFEKSSKMKEKVWILGD